MLMMDDDRCDCREILQSAYASFLLFHDNEEDIIQTDNCLLYDVEKVVPTSWELADVILEECLGKNIRHLSYGGVPVSLSEFLDEIISFLDLEQIEYIDCGIDGINICNDAQMILIPELSVGGDRYDKYRRLQ